MDKRATIYTYLKPRIPYMTLGVLMKFAGALAELLLPYLLSYMIDQVVPLGDRGRILLCGGLMLLAAVAAMTLNIAANRMASATSRDFTRSLRHDLFDRTMRLSSRQIDQFTIPSLIARLTTDSYNLHQTVNSMQRVGIRAPILLVGALAMSIVLDRSLALVMVAMLPVMACIIFFFSRRGIPLYRRQQEGVDALVRTVRENFTGVRVIKALSRGPHEAQRFDAVNRELVRRETRASTTMAMSNPLMSMLLNLTLTAAIVYGAWRVNDGLSQAGVLLAFMSYFTTILNALMSITRVFTNLAKGIASGGRIMQVLNTPEDLLPRQQLPGGDPGAHIAFEHVSFAYQPGGRDQLEDLSFRLERGQTLGIIGATGSGKTTIISLLMRFYDPREGRILIGGRDLRSIDPEELHRMFGVALQNDFLLASSIEDNIRFGREMTQAELELAARDAQAWEFIQALDDGLAHSLDTRGVNFSGGQKQRMLIARALAARPDILILDDASSALDYQTDAALRQAISRDYRGVTTIVVAQRVSSLAHADLILVMEHGRCIGKGTHEQLLQSCEIYAEIYASQMGEVPA